MQRIHHQFPIRQEPVAQLDRRLPLAKHPAYLQRRAAEAHHRDEWSDALQEAEQICEILYLVETAASPNKSWVCRRQALRQLRELLGPEAYAAGHLPPCVPLWRFQPAGR